MSRKKKSPQKVDRHAKRLMTVSEKLRRRRLWEELGEREPYLIEHPDVDGAMVVIVLGDRTEPGLAAFVSGANAWVTWLRVTEGDETVGIPCVSWTVSWGTRGELDPRMLRVVDKAGLHGNHSQLVPCLAAKEVRHEPRPLRDSEVRILADVIDGVLECTKPDRPRPVRAPAGYECPLRVRIDRGGKLLEIGYVEPPPTPWDLESAPVELLGEYDDLPRRTDPVALGMATWQITGATRWPTAMAAIDSRTREIIESDTIVDLSGPRIAEFLNNLFCDNERREPGLPEQIIVQSYRLHRMLLEPLRQCGVEVVVDPGHPAFETYERVAEAIENLLERPEDIDLDDDDDFDDLFDDEDFEDDDLFSEGEPIEFWEIGQSVPIEPPRDAGQWIAAYMRTCVPLHEYADYNIATLGLQYRFMGRGSMEEAARRHPVEIVEVTFDEWLAIDYRARPDASTLVEEWLRADDLNPIQRRILESLRDSWISLFRIISTVPGESLELEDLRTEERYTVRDAVQSKAFRPGECIFFRLCPIEDWYALRVAGPDVLPRRVGEVLGLIESAPRQLPHTEDLRDRADAIGRLWQYGDRIVGPERPLETPDGQPHEYIVAKYALENVERAVDFLVDNPAIRDAESANGICEWEWRSKDGTTLGVLHDGELHTNEMWVQVQSRAHWERLRKLLARNSAFRLIGEVQTPPSAPQMARVEGDDG